MGNVKDSQMRVRQNIRDLVGGGPATARQRLLDSYLDKLKKLESLSDKKDERVYDVSAWVKGEGSTNFIVKASSHSEAKSKCRKRIREDECIDGSKLKGAKWYCRLAEFDDNGVLVG